MYSVRLYNDDYSDNQWYRNGGCRILNDLIRDKNKYGLKFFHDQATSENEIPYFNFDSYSDSFCNVNIQSSQRITLWGVFNPTEVNPFFEDIFKINPIEECPFVIDETSDFIIIKQSLENPLGEQEIKYLKTFCFDSLADRYFLLSKAELDFPRMCYGSEFEIKNNLSFYDVEFTDFKWFKLKTFLEEQKLWVLSDPTGEGEFLNWKSLL